MHTFSCSLWLAAEFTVTYTNGTIGWPFLSDVDQPPARGVDRRHAYQPGRDTPHVSTRLLVANARPCTSRRVVRRLRVYWTGFAVGGGTMALSRPVSALWGSSPRGRVGLDRSRWWPAIT